MKRLARGSALVDVPLSLWILMLGLALPLVDLATTSLRVVLLQSIARDAAMVASRCKTFSKSSSEQSQSAVQAASDIAAARAAKLNGVTLTSVNTYIVVTNLIDRTSVQQSTPLSQPADTDLYVYSIRTIVVGQVSPLITLDGCLFGKVPGLTGPVKISVSTQTFCEFPQGLTQ